MPLLSRILNVFRGDRVSREIAEEMESHIADAVEQGRDPLEARRAFGPALQQREQSRDMRLLGWLDSLRADTIFGWRQLRKRKVTSCAAVLSLALAIGACTTAFRLIDALLLRPLPVAHADRLYVLARQGVDPGGHLRVSEAFEYPLFQQLRATVKDEAELIAVGYASQIDVSYGSDDDLEKATRQFVSGWMFPAFGLKPALGRLFTEDDDRIVHGHPYAVLSYDYWTRRFGRDPNVVGRSFHFFNEPYQIIGVAPREFKGTEPGIGVDLYIPTMMTDQVTRDDSSWFRALVQLKPGVAPESVRQRLLAPYQDAQVERAKGFKSLPPKMVENFLHQQLLLEPAASGNSDTQKDYRGALTALAVLAGLVLLIACANVANLLSAQAAARAREMALRVAIGSGRARLVQLVLLESAMLAALSAALGAIFAWWAAPFVVAHINPPDRPMQLYMPQDWRVTAFALALTLLVTALFGLAPALRASATQPVSALKGEADPHSRRRLMRGLVAGQVAFCFVVLFVAGLFVSTMQRITSQSTGFAPERLLTIDTIAPRTESRESWPQIAESLRALPGVESVAYSMFPLLSGNGWNGFILLNGRPANDQLSYFLGVSPGWLGTMKIPLLDGRDFRPDDTYPGVAIVNQVFARMYFHDENPLGKWFEKGKARLQIVGLAGDSRYRDMREPIAPTAYVPFVRLEANGSYHPEGSATFVVRTAAANPMALASSVRRAIPRAQPSLRVISTRPEQDYVDQHTIRERLLAMLGVFFGLVALLLAGVGLYGVLDYSVVQQRREIGIRMAIGAPAAIIVRGVVSGVLVMVAVGGLAGLGLGMASVRWIESLLYQVRPGDMGMLALPGLTIALVSAAAALPAVVRAIRIDPARALRTE